MGIVVKFYPKNAAEEPDAVLEQAIGEYQTVFVIGINKDGEVDPRASLNADGAAVLWMLEEFKHKLLAGHYFGEDE